MNIPYCKNNGSALSVVVNIQRAADVFLVDQYNFQRYQNGMSFKYYGGHYYHNPVKITVTGHDIWYLIVNDGIGSQYSYRWVQQ